MHIAYPVTTINDILALNTARPCKNSIKPKLSYHTSNGYTVIWLSDTIGFKRAFFMQLQQILLIHPTVSVGWNTLSLSLIPAPGTPDLIGPWETHLYCMMGDAIPSKCYLFVHNNSSSMVTGLILCLRPANERRRLTLVGHKPRLSPVVITTQAYWVHNIVPYRAIYTYSAKCYSAAYTSVWMNRNH